MSFVLFIYVIWCMSIQLGPKFHNSKHHPRCHCQLKHRRVPANIPPTNLESIEELLSSSCILIESILWSTSSSRIKMYHAAFVTFEGCFISLFLVLFFTYLFIPVYVFIMTIRLQWTILVQWVRHVMIKLK